MSRLVALYPREWRNRYEDEYLALLAERPPDPRDRLDIVRGAIDARLHPQVPGTAGTPVERPPVGRWPVIAGWTTLFGAVLWYFAVYLAATGPVVVDGANTYRDGAAAMPFLFLATICLGVGMIAVILTFPPSRLANAAAYVSSLAGLLWGGAPWLFWAGLIAFGGLIVVGFTAWRAGAWSTWRLAALVTCVASPWVLAFLALSGLWASPPDWAQWAIFTIGGLAWPVVGTSLLRPRRTPANTTLGTRQA